MDAIRTSDGVQGVRIVTFDLPGKSVNTISPGVLGELGDVVSAIERDWPAGVIFASGKSKNFIAGADLEEIRRLDREGLELFLRRGQEIFSRIAHLAMPTVAAINGDCLGGGLELALACDHRVAVGEPSVKIGLPEVMLGIIPGWGGTYRMPRLLGLSKALPLLLAGKTLSPKKAMGVGLVDEVVRAEALMDAAARLISVPIQSRKWRLENIPVVRRKIFSAARKRLESQTHGHYPAPVRLLKVVEEGWNQSEWNVLEAERRAVLDLSETPECHNLMRLFFLRQNARRLGRRDPAAVPRDVRYAAVVGGGIMGAGIVHSLILSGITVRLVEINPAAVSAALRRVRGMLDEDVRAGRLDALPARHAMNRVVPCHDWSGLGMCDIAIEAVPEKLELKLGVFEKLDRLTSPRTPLASNTSALSIMRLARMVRDPRRVVGMHFFNPVPKMPLVEIIRTPASEASAVATAVSLAGRLGKTPVLVEDSPGFLVNRVLIPYLVEAARLADEGVSVESIDTAMKQWGWPMGPFELLDQIGLDVAGEVVGNLSGVMPPVLGNMIDRGWLGKKSGWGFYVYGKKTRANPQLRRATVTASSQEIQNRLMEKMFAEARAVLAAGVVDSSDTIDLATVLGLGFPPFRGGLARSAGLVSKGDDVYADVHQSGTGTDGEGKGPDRIESLGADGIRAVPVLRPAENG